jgi:hypothetical protein
MITYSKFLHVNKSVMTMFLCKLWRNVKFPIMFDHNIYLQ